MSVDNNTTPASSNTSNHNHHKADSRFACNICLEAVLEPVVTLCGHLYCWPCLYRWLEPGFSSEEIVSLFGHHNTYRAGGGDESRRSCPVCKSKCSVTSVVPIYVRDGGGRKKDCDDSITTTADETASTTSSTIRRRLRFEQSPIPSRPSFSPQRQQHNTNTTPTRPRQQQQPPLQRRHHLQPPPAALSLQQALLFMPPPVENPTTEFLSRLLIMLGSFVVLCLLLF